MADLESIIRNGSVDDLRAAVPGRVYEELSWDGWSGFALHCAAYYNRVDVIEVLVNEFGADVNRQKGVIALFTPLHHAERGKGYAAAAALILLGADPKRANDRGSNTQEFCALPEVQRRVDPDYKRKLAQAEQEKEAQACKGTWKKVPGESREIVHVYKIHDTSLQITDIFNFQARVWRSVTENTATKGLSSNLILFDDMPDKNILREALRELKKQGGDANDADLNFPRVFGKGLKPS